ncbi:MAG TPA: hypothetical protein VFD72_02175 [Sphingobacteriaceae bacterium]|nr:hypothetical protein [Sphingobacteriaceae bacterium]
MIYPHHLSGQISVTQVTPTLIQNLPKIPAYDSLTNWGIPLKDLNEHWKYIGHQVFLPPIKQGKMDVNHQDVETFLLNIRPHKIPTGFETKYLENVTYGRITNRRLEKFHVYDSIITSVYKPYHYSSTGSRSDPKVFIGTDSAAVSNQYFTIIDVITGNILQKWKTEIEIDFELAKKPRSKPHQSLCCPTVVP